MQWVAASAMIALYLYNLPLVFAVRLDAGGLSFGFGVFRARPRMRPRVRVRRGAKRRKGRRLRKFAVRVLRNVTLERLDVDLTLGTGDAALTAEACGLISLALGMIRAATGAQGRVRVRPDFAHRTLTGAACGIARLTAGHLIRAALFPILRGDGG